MISPRWMTWPTVSGTQRNRTASTRRPSSRSTRFWTRTYTCPHHSLSPRKGQGSNNGLVFPTWINYRSFSVYRKCAIVLSFCFYFLVTYYIVRTSENMRCYLFWFIEKIYLYAAVLWNTGVGCAFHLSKEMVKDQSGLCACVVSFLMPLLRSLDDSKVTEQHFVQTQPSKYSIVCILWSPIVSSSNAYS